VISGTALPTITTSKKSFIKKPGNSIVLLLLFVVFFIAQIPNFQLDASSDSLVLEGDNKRYHSQ
jgi:hypothetical protein